MKKLITGLLSCFAVVLLMVPMAHAQTPDGETPANEGVCDALQTDGTTKGLYGLCVAFCEAQDAEATFNPATQEVTFAEGSRPSHPKLLEIYNRKKDENDPPMPCVNVVPDECPCWTEEDILTTGFPSTAQIGRCDTNEEAEGAIAVGLEFDPDFTFYLWAAGLDDNSTTGYSCHRIPASDGGGEFYLETTATAAETCWKSVITMCKASGL